MSPTAPAASSRIARPPRMISGSGNDVAPPGELFWIAFGTNPGGFLLPGSGVVVVVVPFLPPEAAGAVVVSAAGGELVIVGAGAFGFFWCLIASCKARSMSSRALE